jgi:hypothetical protein
VYLVSRRDKLPAMPPRRLSTEVITDEMAAVMRRKTGAERLAIVDSLYRCAWALVEGNVRTTHPDWNDTRVKTAVAARIAGGAE